MYNGPILTDPMLHMDVADAISIPIYMKGRPVVKQRCMHSLAALTM